MGNLLLVELGLGLIAFFAVLASLEARFRSLIRLAVILQEISILAVISGLLLTVWTLIKLSNTAGNTTSNLH